MVLKLFRKKDKSQEYFLEIKDANTPATETVTTEVEGDNNAVATATPATPATPPGDVSYDVPDWVKAIKNYSNSNSDNASVTGENNFAGKYLTNTVPLSRRRPGGSLATFKNMASQIGK